MNLTVTAKGTDMKFKWLKHGEHRDDDKAISQDDDQYCMTVTVIDHGHMHSISMPLDHHPTHFGQILCFVPAPIFL